MSRHPLAERALSASAVLNGCSLEALRGGERPGGAPAGRDGAGLHRVRDRLLRALVLKALARPAGAHPRGHEAAAARRRAHLPRWNGQQGPHAQFS